MMIRDGVIVYCGICGEPVPAKATGSRRITKGGKGSITVDHITPKAWGGDDSIRNLQPAHQLCNQKKADKTDYPKVI